MALNILQQHAQVFLDRLEADAGPPPLVVLSGSVPRDAATNLPSVPPPYVLVYIGFRALSGETDPDKVGMEELASDGFFTVATCHSVGGNQHAALAVGGRVRAALLGVVPAIAGREVGPIKLSPDEIPVQRDETTGVLVADFVQEYEFLSLPG